MKKEYPTISFINGWGFGITEEGRTICLGKEADVLKALANPKQRSPNHSINEIIDRERELMKTTTMPVSTSGKSTRKGIIPKVSNKIPKVGKRK